MVAQNMLRTREVFTAKKIRFKDDVANCLQQIEMPDLLHVSASCSELPSNISTLGSFCAGQQILIERLLLVIYKLGNVSKN